MKKLGIILLTTATMFSGCKKVLDKEPLGRTVEENFYKTDKDLLAAVTAAYSPLLNEGPGGPFIPFFFLGDIVSDDSRKGSNTIADIIPYHQLETFSATPDNQELLTYWNNHYLGLRRANIVIEQAPKSPVSQEVKNRVLGEAKFLRAFYHFRLVQVFGDVPLLDHVLQPNEFEQARAPKASVYALIEQDLKDAASLLTDKAPQPGAATKGAANALLAKAYLFQNKFSESLQAAEAVIKSGNYSLIQLTGTDKAKDFANIFSASNKNNIESIFEIQFAPQAGNTNWMSPTGTIANIMMRGRDNKGWGFNNPNTNLYQEFESGDPRREGTLFKDGDVMFENSDGKGLVEKFDAPDTVAAPNQTPYGTRKYIEPVSAIGSNISDGPSNYIAIRYADVLLIAAEAANATNNDGLAQTYLNQVRSRAGLLPVTSTGTELKTAIWHERRVELAMEGHRFFDLVRQGRAAEVMQKTGDEKFIEGRNFKKGINEVFPIPQTEIGLSQGKIIQNPGY